jgi:cephalosporin-C deacetylase-like acetyl esterase
MRAGNLVVSVDVRGIGETSPPHPDDSGRGLFGHVDDAETTMLYMAWEMNESLFGMRVQDVIRSVDYALSRADVDHSGVRVIGRNRGALWVLFSAALDPRISHAICDHGLVSYRVLTSSDRYLHAADILIRKVLQYFDLPQVAAAIYPRRLSLVAPVDAMKSVVDGKTAREAYWPAVDTYRSAGVPEHFVVSHQPESASGAEHYLHLLG